MDDLKRAAVAALEALPEAEWPEVVCLAMGRRAAAATLAAAAQAGGGQ